MQVKKGVGSNCSIECRHDRSARFQARLPGTEIRIFTGNTLPGKIGCRCSGPAGVFPLSFRWQSKLVSGTLRQYFHVLHCIMEPILWPPLG